MLRAFTYYDPEEEDRIRKGIKDNEFFEQELAIAQRYCEGHPFKGTLTETCPICGSKDVSVFFEKWGIPYSRCKECYSIYANVDEQDVQGYLALDDRQEIRSSQEYQRDAAETRLQMWEDVIDWIGFRAFRYLGKNDGLTVLDYGNRWEKYRSKLQKAAFCKKYVMRADTNCIDSDYEKYDVVLAMDFMQRKTEPYAFLDEVKELLDDTSIFILGTKAGSGLDVLLLKGNNRNVFPYEHLLMPSKQGIEIMLEKAGFDLLEFTTPGSFDVNYVKGNIAEIPEDDTFIKYLFETITPQGEAELQRFVQKAGLSSYAQVIARKKGKKFE